MPDVYGPFTAQTWGQAQWFRNAFALGPSGVISASNYQSYDQGDLRMTVAGLTITMGLGRARVRGAGYERTGTAWSYDVPANTNPTQARIDRLVLRRDLAAGTVVPVVLLGTPAASPAAPAITQVEDGVWDLPLHSWTTPANSAAPLTNIVDERSSLPSVVVGRDNDRVTANFADIGVGWSWSAGAWVRRVAPGVAIAYLEVTTTVAVTVPADGNIGNTTVCTLRAGWRPLDTSPLLGTATGPVVTGTAAASGVVQLTAVAPGVTLPVGTTISLHGYLFLQ